MHARMRTRHSVRRGEGGAGGMIVQVWLLQVLQHATSRVVVSDPKPALRSAPHR